MVSFGYILLGAVALIALASCTGESVRIVIPERHPANPTAAEAPFAMPPDPFAGITDLTPSPTPREAPTDHHGHSSHDRHEKPNHGSGAEGMPGGPEGAAGEERKK